MNVNTRSVPATARVAAMVATATDTLARVRLHRRRFLCDPRSVLDRPALADCTDRLVLDVAHVFDAAVEALAVCTPADPAAAATALAKAQSAEYAAQLADQHARRLARHGFYPGARRVLNARTLDVIEEARASLELAATACDAMAAAHRRRAHALVCTAGIEIPELLQPAWAAGDDGSA